MSNHARVVKPLLVIALATAVFCQRSDAAVSEAGDELFADDALPHLRIEISAPAMEILRGYAFRWGAPQTERPSVNCMVREGTNTWTDVVIHLKGSLGSFRGVDDTPSFTLNFSKHNPQQRFHGLEKISLNTSVQDPTRISEKLCRELYRRGGVPVPRAGYATAELNGRGMGVFVLLEGWNRQFIARHFPDAHGPLYEGPFLTDIDKPPLISFGKPRPKDLNFTQLLAAAREPESSKRLARLEAVLDVERFTRLLALDLLLWNGDGYAMHANNYRVFHDPRQERFVFLPHGLDQMGAMPDAPVLAGGDGIVAWALLSLPEGRRRVIERIHEFRNTFYQPDALRKRAMEIATPVGLALGREAGLSNAAPPAHTQAVEAWLARLTERIGFIDQQLAGISNLVSARSGQTFVPLTWAYRPIAGTPVFAQPTNTSLLTLRTATGSTGAWVTVQWLEHGRYRLTGMVRHVTDTATTNQASAGFRVRAPRKRSLGLDWGWDSRRRADHLPGDERRNLACQPLAASAGTNWTELNCEIDLRQPVADLEILCEASGPGEASFDLQSLKITRLTDPGRD